VASALPYAAPPIPASSLQASMPVLPHGTALANLGGQVAQDRATLVARLSTYDELQQVLNDPSFRGSLERLKRIEGKAALLLGDSKLSQTAANAFDKSDDLADAILDDLQLNSAPPLRQEKTVDVPPAASDVSAAAESVAKGNSAAAHKLPQDSINTNSGFAANHPFLSNNAPSGAGPSGEAASRGGDDDASRCSLKELGGMCSLTATTVQPAEALLSAGFGAVATCLKTRGCIGVRYSAANTYSAVVGAAPLRATVEFLSDFGTLVDSFDAAAGANNCAYDYAQLTPFCAVPSPQDRIPPARTTGAEARGAAPLATAAPRRGQSLKFVQIEPMSPHCSIAFRGRTAWCPSSLQCVEPRPCPGGILTSGPDCSEDFLACSSMGNKCVLACAMWE